MYHQLHELNCPSVETDLVNPYPAKLKDINFPPLEVVSRHRDPQLQVGEHY